MALRREAPPVPAGASAAGSPPPLASQGGRDDGAEVDVARKMEEEVDHLLAKFKNAGKEIDEEMARIKAEAATAREAIKQARRNDKITLWLIVPDVAVGLMLFTVASGCIGFYLGARWYEEYLLADCNNLLGTATFFTKMFSRRS